MKNTNMKNTNTQNQPNKAQAASIMKNAKQIITRIKVATEAMDETSAKKINQELLNMTIFETYLILKSMKENELSAKVFFSFAKLIRIGRDYQNFDRDTCIFNRILGYLYNGNEITGDGTYYHHFYQNGLIFEKYTLEINKIFMEVK